MSVRRIRPYYAGGQLALCQYAAYYSTVTASHWHLALCHDEPCVSKPHTNVPSRRHLTLCQYAAYYRTVT
eukprot:721399-Rhodomonas_salina.1